MNRSQTLSNKDILFIGLMTFSLFFGAGNLIFPPELGREAGDHFLLAIGGFLISGVGLPLLGILAIAYVSDRGSSDDLGKKVHPIFAVVLTSMTYLTIGPFFAVPRTGVVSYEIAIVPFLQGEDHSFTLVLFSIFYFLVVYLLALNPGKFVDRFGKVITPFLLVSLFILIAAILIKPFNIPPSPSNDYVDNPLFKGITEGYLTMDAIVSIVFAMIIINSIRKRGVREKRMVQIIIWKAGAIAVFCLSAVYIGLGYLGATSTSLQFKTGASILSGVSEAYFGIYGNIILGLVILLACIPTATGLISSCALYFNKVIPSMSYKTFVTIFVLFSGMIANVGLEQLINLSIPVLNFIYPIIIVLIFLAFLDKLFSGQKLVYRFAVLFTAIVSLNDGLVAINRKWDFISPIMNLPFNELGFGWIVPALIGGVIGWLISLLKKE